MKLKPVELNTDAVLSVLDLVKGLFSYRFGGRMKRGFIRYILDSSLRKDQTNNSVDNKNIFFKKTSFFKPCFFAKINTFF